MNSSPASAWYHALDRQSFTTAVLTWAAFAWLFDARTSTLLLLVVFVHEMGHLLTIRVMTGNVAKIRFVPFLGGYTQYQGGWLSPLQSGFFALGGPAIGTLFALGCLIAFHQTHEPLLWHLAWIGVILNGLNLIPLPPLDGGQITRWLGRGWWLTGVALVLWVAWWQQTLWTMAFVALLLWQAWQYHDATKVGSFCPRCQSSLRQHALNCERCALKLRLSFRQKVLLWGCYLGTLIVLAGMMSTME
ncbi:metalloprotease [Pokkaliibacter sp. CJK22405]|uniref:metalloprotease n=1 Tax=Pokkaliibacter sp. CJK22405 TaxID=3384615 RepID=UPI003984C7D3